MISYCLLSKDEKLSWCFLDQTQDYHTNFKNLILFFNIHFSSLVFFDFEPSTWNTDCSVCVLFKISCATDESVSEEFMTHSYNKMSWTSPPMWPDHHIPTDLSPCKLSDSFCTKFLFFFLVLHPWGPYYWLFAEMKVMIKLKISRITVSNYKDGWYVSWVIICSVVQGITGSVNLRNSVYLCNSIKSRWLGIWFQV